MAPAEVTNAEIVRLKDQLQKRTDRMREIEEDKKRTMAAIEEENARKVSDVEKERDLERKRADKARRTMEENKAEHQDEIDKLKSKVEVLNRSLAHAEEMAANHQPSHPTPAVDTESQSVVTKVLESVNSIRAILDLPAAPVSQGRNSSLALSQHLDSARQALESTLTATRARIAQAEADGRAEKAAEADKAVAERKSVEKDLVEKIAELVKVKSSVTLHQSERKALQDKYDELEASHAASNETLRADLEAERIKMAELDAARKKVAEVESRLVKFKADSEALDVARAKIKSLEEQLEERRRGSSSALEELPKLEDGLQRELDELANKLDEANSELLTRRSKENELEDEVRQLKAEIERVRHDNKSLSEVRGLCLSRHSRL